MPSQPFSVKNDQTNSLFGVDVSRGLTSVAGQASKYISNVINPSQNRLLNAGLNIGAQIGQFTTTKAKFAEEDWRVRLSCPTPGLFYNNSSNTVLNPLTKTNGLIFPYTPQIMLSHSANYSSLSPTHSNYPQQFYNHSSVDNFSIASEFTAQNQEEARYVLAAIIFLRSLTKMFWGTDELAGTPPPVLRLNGYGDYIFNNIPVVVTTFTIDLSGDIDYINTFVQNKYYSGIDFSDLDVDEFGDYSPLSSPSFRTLPTRVPTKSNITVSLLPLYSREQMKEFGLTKFTSGELLVDKKQNKGGFI